MPIKLLVNTHKHFFRIISPRTISPRIISSHILPLSPQPRKMSTKSPFHIKTHITPTQHTRSRPAATSPGTENNLSLHLKQYIPKSNPNPSEGDVTILGAVADSYPKEIYEPLWEYLLFELEKRGTRVRGIWVADPANQGESGVLNEGILGPDPSWWDHGRDLLLLVNLFGREIRHPIVGVGHSMGGSHL